MDHQIEDHIWIETEKNEEKKTNGVNLKRAKINLLDSHWINDATHFETALFELHYGRVVDACAFGEN